MKAQAERFAVRQRCRIAHNLTALQGDHTVAAREDIVRTEMRQIAGEPVKNLITLQQTCVRCALQSRVEHRQLLLLTADVRGKPRQARVAQLQLRRAAFVQPVHRARQTFGLLREESLLAAELIRRMHHHARQMIQALRMCLG